MQALFPHPAGTCSLDDVAEACSLFEDGDVRRLVFNGRSVWRFLFDVMHGVIAVVGEDGERIEIEEVTTAGSANAWRLGVIVAVRDVLERVLRAKVLDELDQWTIELLLQEIEALIAEDSLAEALGAAVAARDTVVALALDGVPEAQESSGND